MPSNRDSVICLCWRCTESGRKPKGRFVSRKVERDHRKKDWRPYLPQDNRKTYLQQIDSFSDEGEASASDVASASSPPPSKTVLEDQEPAAGVVVDHDGENPPLFDNDNITSPVSPDLADNLSTASEAVSDTAMEELTGNFSRVTLGDDFLRSRIIAGREAAWEMVSDDEDVPSDEDEDEDEDEDYAGEEDPFEWDFFERAGENGRLTAYELLDAQFNARVAHLRESLILHDLEICRSYAWKLRAHTTDHAFKAMRYAYPQLFDDEDGLPSLDEHRSRIAFLSGIKAEKYDCCINSCICYVGPHENLTNCPFCNQPRHRSDGKPRKSFSYIPLLPRLQGFFQNKKIAELLQYRANFRPQPGIISDVFDSKLYQDLREQEIEFDGEMSLPRYFADSRDIALGLSTDGFAPFKRRRHTAWPLIIFVYNLPPEIRFHVEHILSLGVIPGPLKPKDICSFLYLVVMELWKLAKGVNTFDILSDTQFSLRAFLILVFGDIPAVSMIMRMKGHNGYAPCRMCHITGIRMDGGAGNTLYVPLDRSTHPDVINSESDTTAHFDPAQLPLRSHREFYQQAMEVEGARTNRETERLARLYGIKGLPILYYVKSLQFPQSFPYDIMHLVFENLVPNLILLWTNQFKGLDSGSEDYTIESSVWEAVGARTAAAGSTIPSAFGTRVPDLAKGGVSISAEMYSLWAQYIGPTVLRHCFTQPQYYTHFVLLVRLLTICLQFEITTEEIQWLREGFNKWVQDFERIYYQYNPSRLSTCTLTIHGLLHIADSIEIAGPPWCYWAFSMERYCGHLQPGIRSRRFPFASLDRYVLEKAQISQIGILYDVAADLALRPPRHDPPGSIRIPGYDAALLLRPHTTIPSLPARVIGALATRYNLDGRVSTLKRDILGNAIFTEWAQVRRVDSDAGDTMVASKYPSLARANRQDFRDASFVRYEMLVDINANKRRVQPKFEKQNFYGQLQHIYVVNFNNPLPIRKYNIPACTSVVMVEIESCAITEEDPHLDLRFYSKMGRIHPIDLTALQCLVGRVPDGSSSWGIFDRSGSLARAMYLDDDN